MIAFVLKIMSQNFRFKMPFLKTHGQILITIYEIKRFRSCYFQNPSNLNLQQYPREMTHNFKRGRQTPHQELQSQEGMKTQESRPLNRDYITLKNKITKSKVQNEEQLLEYYTTQKFNEYFKTLTPIKAIYPAQAQQQIKQLQQMVQIGHNVCVFGRGSKIDLLKNLHGKKLANYNTFQIKAYLPSITDKKIYSHFGGFLIDINLETKIEAITLKQQAAKYKEILNKEIQNKSRSQNKNKSRLVVIIHSIDGPNLLNTQSQEKLAELFDHPSIQVICSLDNMKIVMNWSPITLQKFRFLFFNIDTKQPYIQQLKYRSLKNENRESTEDSLMYVWQSLNKNQKHIAKFIALNELKNLGLQESQATHYTFNDLLQLCIEEIVLSSDYQLRQNLLELLDHKIILQRNDEKKNKKIYVMKYEKRALEKIVDFKVQ